MRAWFALMAFGLAVGCGSESESSSAPVAESVEPEPAQSSQPTAAVGPDPDFAGCQGSCGSDEPFDPAELVGQPGASVGDLIRCPVSDAVFRVVEDQPYVEHDGQRYYVCCSSCAGRFREEPARFARPSS